MYYTQSNSYNMELIFPVVIYVSFNVISMPKKIIKNLNYVNLIDKNRLSARLKKLINT